MNVLEELDNLLKEGYTINLHPRGHSMAGVNIFKAGEIQYSEPVYATESCKSALYRAVLSIDELKEAKKQK